MGLSRSPREDQWDYESAVGHQGAFRSRGMWRDRADSGLAYAVVAVGVVSAVSVIWIEDWPFFPVVFGGLTTALEAVRLFWKPKDRAAVYYEAESQLIDLNGTFNTQGKPEDGRIAYELKVGAVVVGLARTLTKVSTGDDDKVQKRVDELLGGLTGKAAEAARPQVAKPPD